MRCPGAVSIGSGHSVGMANIGPPGRLVGTGRCEGRAARGHEEGALLTLPVRRGAGDGGHDDRPHGRHHAARPPPPRNHPPPVGRVAALGGASQGWPTVTGIWLIRGERIVTIPLTPGPKSEVMSQTDTVYQITNSFRPKLYLSEHAQQLKPV